MSYSPLYKAAYPRRTGSALSYVLYSTAIAALIAFGVVLGQGFIATNTDTQTERFVPVSTRPPAIDNLRDSLGNPSPSNAPTQASTDKVAQPVLANTPHATATRQPTPTRTPSVIFKAAPVTPLGTQP